MTKEEFQKNWAKNQQREEVIDPKNQLRYFFPDMTNPEYQEFLLHLIEKQIDSGVDAIRIDMLFTQPSALALIAKSTGHKSVSDSCKAVSKIVDEIHTYGYLKGKKIYVGSWQNSFYTKETGFIQVCKDNPPSLDFIHLSPLSSEVANMRFDENYWDRDINGIRESFGNITIFAFIDWAFTTNSPLGVFSQKLTLDEQKEFLKIADEFFQRKGIIFIYPVHGGYMGYPENVLSYRYSSSKNTFYDALAPEFQTYETIKELAQSKK